MLKFLIFSLVLIQILPEHLCDEITEDNEKAIEDSGESSENNSNVAIVQSDGDDSSEFRRNNDGENKDNFNRSYEEPNIQPPFIGSDHDDEEILRINFRSSNKSVENATKHDTPVDLVNKAQETILQGEESIRVNVTNDNQNSAATSENPKKMQSIESTTISKVYEAHILANKPVNEIDKDKDKVKEANETTSKEKVGNVPIGASIDELIEKFVKTSAKTVATPSPNASQEIIYFGKTEKDDVSTKTTRHDRALTDLPENDKQSQNQDKSATVITEKVKLVSEASDKVPVKVSALTTAADKFELKPTTVGQNNHWNSNLSGLFLFRRNKINDFLAGSDLPYSKAAMDPDTERKTKFLIKMVNNIAVDQTLLRHSNREPSRPILRILEPKQPNIVNFLNNLHRRALLEQDRLHYINNPEVLENYVRRRSLNRRSESPILDEEDNNMKSRERYKLTEDNRDNYYVDKKKHRLKKKHIKEAMEKQKKADRERRYKERRKARLFSRRSLSDLLSGTADITNIYPESDVWEHRRRRPNNRQIKAQRRLIFNDQIPINVHINREDRNQELIQQQLRPIDRYQQETDKLWRNYDRHIFTSLEDNEEVIKMDPHQARRMFLRKVRALRAKNRSTDESKTDEETDKIDVFDADAVKDIKSDAKKDIKNNDQDGKVKDDKEKDKEDDKDKKEYKNSEEEEKYNKEDKGTVTKMEDWDSVSVSNEKFEKESERKSKEVALIRSETKDKKMEKGTLNSKVDWYTDIDAQDFKNVNVDDEKDQNKWNDHKDNKNPNSDEIDKLQTRPIKLTSADKMKKEDTSIKEKSVTTRKKSEWDDWPRTVKSIIQKKINKYDYNDKPRDMTGIDDKGYSDKKKRDDYDVPRYKKDDFDHSSYKIDDFARFSNKKEDLDRLDYKKNRFDGPYEKKEDDDDYNSKSKKTSPKNNSNKDKFDRPSDKKDDFDRPNYKKDDFSRPNYKEDDYDDYTNKGKKSKLKANNNKYDFDQSTNKKDNLDRPNFEKDNFNQPSHKNDDHGYYESKSKTTDYKLNNDKYDFDRPSKKKDDFDRPNHKKDDFYGPDYKKEDDYYNSRTKKMNPIRWNDKFDKEDFDKPNKKDNYEYGKSKKKSPETDSNRNDNDPGRYRDDDDYKNDDRNRYNKDDYDYHSSKSKTSKKSSDGTTHKWDKIDNDWSKVGIPSKKSAKDRHNSKEKQRTFQNKRKDSYEYKDRDIDIIDSREKKKNGKDKRIDYDDDRDDKYLSKKNKNKDYNDEYEDKVKVRKNKIKEYDDDKHKERPEKYDVNKNKDKENEKDTTSATKVTKKSFKRRNEKSKIPSTLEDNLDPKHSNPLRSSPIIEREEDISPDNSLDDHENENKYQRDDQKGNKDILRGHKEDKKRVDHVFFNKEDDWSKIGVDETKKNPSKRPLKPWKVHDDVDNWGKGTPRRERGQNTRHVGAHTVLPSKLLKGLFDDY